MKKQSILSQRIKISLLMLVLVGSMGLAAYGQACGDVNGSGTVDIVDALQIAQYFVGSNPAGFNASVADVDGNGTVDIVDALKVAQLFVGLISSLNCSGVVPNPTPVAGETPVPPVGTAVPPAVTPGGAGCTGSAGAHLDNPYSGAKLYVNADWTVNASKSSSALGNVPTFFWIDRIAAITGGSGSCTFTSLTQHLDRAVAQGANAVQIVVYDMPNRDCSASASNGELLIAADGVNRYKTEFIDPIVAIFKTYTCLRIICVYESDSIPNLVTNLSFPRCAEANSTGAYQTCMQYGINQFNTLSNVYLYIDVAHSAWLGWASNFAPFMDKVTGIIKGTTKGVNSIDGFVDNTANTLPYVEPFIPNGDMTVGGQPVKNSTFYDFNPYTEESTYMADLRAGFISRGFPSTIGMILDTGRNGWGGAARPKAASTSTDLNTWVDASRIDRRYHRGNWCNQGVAGIGARPQTAPAAGIDAFVWVKPPGESDGQSAMGTDPCDPNKTLDQMCAPGGINTYCGCGTNGAMAGAPSAGGWFPALMNALVANANPAL
jgi:cellulose 1,4-beta-cellobiosidase